MPGELEGRDMITVVGCERKYYFAISAQRDTHLNVGVIIIPECRPTISLNLIIQILINRLIVAKQICLKFNSNFKVYQKFELSNNGISRGVLIVQQYNNNTTTLQHNNTTPIQMK